MTNKPETVVSVLATIIRVDSGQGWWLKSILNFKFKTWQEVAIFSQLIKPDTEVAIFSQII